MKTVFVTVGTTSFDELIETVVSPEVLAVLNSQGYTKVLLQVGKGSTPKVEGHVEPSVESYNFKDSLTRDINEASLVISHGGAGSILQALRAGKKLVAVVNDKLLHNHQSELAGQLHKEGYLLYCTCKDLQATLEEMEPSRLRTFPEPNLNRFPQLLDGIMGWS
ncbi:UDP-N-acetylglucosamine transferase subunit ALG13 [Dermacentor andersoni]|uniref:UDP-N-acetylglucosamine transferase subunit ALG13 n=1 Tax=Dermacentor andersoni TaxID=34620 RepID=UPI002155E45C|nr:UDP-N-acetylglucosamine transferase subunit ALG13 homolog [Dermacentor andersoni]XP_054926267.1 UDP-N-acetylglucosamine transferase subunit ALG13 homolog [Dermacentor andersoni]